MTDSFESDSSRSRSLSSDSRYSNSSSRRSPLRHSTSQNRGGAPPPQPTGGAYNAPSGGGARIVDDRNPSSPSGLHHNASYTHNDQQHNTLDTTGPYPIQVPPDQVPVSYDRPPPPSRQNASSARFAEDDDDAYCERMFEDAVMLFRGVNSRQEMFARE